jgi:hypothetical protein
MLKLVVIDEEVGYEQEIFINVHNIMAEAPAATSVLVELYCNYHGELLRFSSWEEIVRMDKRKLLALREIVAILS